MTDNSMQAEVSKDSKMIYEAPILQELGNVRDLTQQYTVSVVVE